MVIFLAKSIKSQTNIVCDTAALLLEMCPMYILVNLQNRVSKIIHCSILCIVPQSLICNSEAPKFLKTGSFSIRLAQIHLVSKPDKTIYSLY